MKNKKLDVRELNFIDRVENLGKFEYVGGYDNIKGNVKVIHKKCGNETIMKAYAVAYSDIDKCKECGRQVRDFDKCKAKIEKDNPDLVVLSREKDDFGKNRYYVMCRNCGDVLYLSYDVLKIGNYKCCSDGMRAYERASEYKAKELFNELKRNRLCLNDEELMDYIYNAISTQSYLKTSKGLYDTWKLSKTILKYIKDRQDKEKIGVCSKCGEFHIGTKGWGRGTANFNSKICLNCAKLSVECSICHKHKRNNTFSIEDGKYTDICCSCNTKIKELEKKKKLEEETKDNE